MLHRWAVRLGDPDAAAHAAAMCHRRTEPTPPPGWAASCTRCSNARVLTRQSDATSACGRHVPAIGPDHGGPAKPRERRTDSLLAAKGGHNGEHHNHRDVGSVVVAVDGVPLLVDAGQPTYTAQTFGPDRYGIRAMQSDWHSVPAPFGLEQGTGRSTFAAGVLQEPTPEGRSWSSAWERPTVSTPRALDPDLAELHRDPGRIVIDDRWDLPRTARGNAPRRNGRRRHHLPDGRNRLILGPGRDGDRPPGRHPGG